MFRLVGGTRGEVFRRRLHLLLLLQDFRSNAGCKQRQIARKRRMCPLDVRHDRNRVGEGRKL